MGEDEKKHTYVTLNFESEEELYFATTNRRVIPGRSEIAYIRNLENTHVLYAISRWHNSVIHSQCSQDPETA